MYEAKKWVDEIVDAESGETIQEGTPLSAGNLNNMEQGITDAHIATMLLMIAMSNKTA